MEEGLGTYGGVNTPKKLTQELRYLAGDGESVYVNVDQSGVPLSFRRYAGGTSRARGHAGATGGAL